MATGSAWRLTRRSRGRAAFIAELCCPSRLGGAMHRRRTLVLLLQRELPHAIRFHFVIPAIIDGRS